MAPKLEDKPATEVTMVETAVAEEKSKSSKKNCNWSKLREAVRRAFGKLQKSHDDFCKRQKNASGYFSSKLKSISERLWQRPIFSFVLVFIFCVIIVLILNLVWADFENEKRYFPSPLGYSDALSLAVDVFLAFVIAGAQLKVELRWKKIEENQKDIDEKKHKDELVSDRIRELTAFFNTTAEGYVNAKGIYNHCPVKHNNMRQGNPDFAIVISPQNGEHLIPPYLSMELTNPKGTVSVGNGSYDFETIDKIILNERLYQDEFIIPFKCGENSKDAKKIFDFLNAVTYIKKENSILPKMEFSMEAHVTDKSIKIGTEQNKENLNFDCKISFSISPSDSYTKKGSFSCKVVCTEILLIYKS